MKSGETRQVISVARLRTKATFADSGAEERGFFFTSISSLPRHGVSLAGKSDVLSTRPCEHAVQVVVREGQGIWDASHDAGRSRSSQTSNQAHPHAHEDGCLATTLRIAIGSASASVVSMAKQPSQCGAWFEVRSSPPCGASLYNQSGTR